MLLNSKVLIAFLGTEAVGLCFNGITLFYILSNFDVKIHVFTLVLLGKNLKNKPNEESSVLRLGDLDYF